MSSDATKIPGLQVTDNGSIYSRTNAQSNPSRPKGTIVPGMNVYAPQVEEQGAEPEVQQVPVVGFLYSISRQGFGEYWPLHIGSNTIGRSNANDICLAEQTVSEPHARLNIKQLKSTGKILASIQDVGSKNGIYVNDDELGYETHEVKNHDIITIGNNYKLLVILIDAKEMGLSIAEDFQPANDSIEEKTPDIPQPGNPDDTSSLYRPTNRVENGTVAMDGSTAYTSGRTQVLK